jgi:hypothetical protein
VQQIPIGVPSDTTPVVIGGQLQPEMKITPVRGRDSVHIKHAEDLLSTARAGGNGLGHVGLYERQLSLPTSRLLYKQGTVKFDFGSQSWDSKSSACLVKEWGPLGEGYFIIPPDVSIPVPSPCLT